VRLSLSRLLDDTYEPEVRERLGLLTLSRLISTSSYRFTPPFLATIARGLDVSLSEIGIALALSELSGLLSPFLGSRIDRLPRRATMSVALMLVAIGATIAALSPNRWVFAVALAGLSLANATFVISMNGWFADRVPYERRSRVVGIVEFSWAGGLLIGVPLMGLVTALTSWRWGFGVGAISGVVMSVSLYRRFASTPEGHHAGTRESKLPKGWWRRAAAPIAANGMLMAAAQCAFVTFGSWLEDDFDFTAGKLSAIAFGLGVGEFAASSGTVRFTDRLGKRRAMMLGTGLMVPMGLLLATPLRESLWLGLPILIVYILGFEFGVVSSIPIGTNVIPGHPSTGMGLMFGAGTIGRATTAIAAAWLYDQHGFEWSMLLGVGCAVASIALMWLERHHID
jgi:predicted MFS family arabinose efflux permease